MNHNDFRSELEQILLHTLVAPGRPIRWTAIANPKAGGFTIPRRWKQHLSALQECVATAQQNPLREDIQPSALAGERQGLILTQGPGHASAIVEALLKEAEEHRLAYPDPYPDPYPCSAGSSQGRRPFHLIVCAGGDGTSLEALVALFYAKPEALEDFAVLRLPMGTGNDAADAWTLAEALDLLIRPVAQSKARAIQLSTATPGKGPFLAFNILSVGLDAFVTHWTNKMKGKLPGDSYKLWVDIASILYDRLYRVGPMDIQTYNEDGQADRALRETTLLLAFGASGNRTYGSHNRILPDERNVCLIRQTSLLRKAALKGLIKAGTHAQEKEALLFHASRVEFRGEYPILAQMDGETVLLEKADFPAVITLTSPVIPILTAVPEFPK